VKAAFIPTLKASSHLVKGGTSNRLVYELFRRQRPNYLRIAANPASKAMETEGHYVFAP